MDAPLLVVSLLPKWSASSASSTLTNLSFLLFTCYVLWLLSPYLSRIKPLPNSLANVRGPNTGSVWRGNIPQLFARHSWAFQNGLGGTYGMAVKLTSLFGKPALYVFDPTALYHIVIKDQQVYERTRFQVALAKLVFGDSLLGTLGGTHRRQRKILNPAFSILHMRHMTPIFYQTIHRLREAIQLEISQSPSRNRETGVEIDILSWMGRVALELIGQGGLGYSFDPLVKTEHNTFGEALKDVFPTVGRCTTYRFLCHHANKFGPPRLRRIFASLFPDRNIQKLKRIIDSIEDRSKEILEAKKGAILVEGDDEVLKMEVGEGKDIMSILLRANMKTEGDDKLPDHELVAQVSTLVLAATDTTSNALARIFELLAQHQDVQDKLRQEILDACDSQDGSFTDIPHDKLVELPYLDAVCRETLRLYPPSSFVMRETRQDIMLPMSEPVQGVDGSYMQEILVPNNTLVFVGIQACNRNKAIWGEDALEWKPERWLNSLPNSIKEAKVPGIYANLMTFLGGGNACIGFKFSQLEMKVVIAVLLSSFKFLHSGKDIVWNFATVAYPTVGPIDETPSLPLQVFPLEGPLRLGGNLLALC